VVVCAADILKGARAAGGGLLVLIDARTAAQGAEVVPVIGGRWWCALLTS
jgi:hypothetical protein